MSLTRKLLRELELTEPAIERIIAAHVETVDGLRQERDSALNRAAQIESSIEERDALRTLAEERLQQAAAAQEELTAYRTQVDAQRLSSARRAALTEALTTQGANPQAIPLLLDAIQLQEEDWTDASLTDAAAALQPWRTKYSALFTAKSPLPVTRVNPPVNGGGILTHADVKRMSATDINRNWSAVRSALERH